MVNEVSNRRGDIWDPFFDRMSKDLMKGFGRNELDWDSRVLKTDVSESETEYKVKIDVPGIEKKHIKLNYADNQLTIEVKKDSFEDHGDQDHNVTMNERSYGMMRRSYNLPGVDATKISAKQDNGVLNLVLPKHAGPTDSQITIE